MYMNFRRVGRKGFHHKSLFGCPKSGQVKGETCPKSGQDRQKKESNLS